MINLISKVPLLSRISGKIWTYHIAYHYYKIKSIYYYVTTINYPQNTMLEMQGFRVLKLQHFFNQ